MKPFRRLPYPLLGAIAVSALWPGCATAPRFPAGQAILKGEAPRIPPAPDSLRSELDLTVFSGGRKNSVSAALSIKPWKAYKLDLFGLPGMVAGSFLWTPERWNLVIFDRQEYLEGAGEHVAIGALGLGETSVHDLFGFLWGDFFPGDAPQAGAEERMGAKDSAAPPAGLRSLGNGAFAYTAPGARWRVNLDGKTGLVREAWREDSTFRIAFMDYRADYRLGDASGRPVPRTVRLYRFRQPMLEIKVKTAEDNPSWRRDPFFIKIPKGFHKLERVGAASAPAPEAGAAPK